LQLYTAERALISNGEKLAKFEICGNILGFVAKFWRKFAPFDEREMNFLQQNPLELHTEEVP